MTVLILGGYCQGKTEFAQNHFPSTIPKMDDLQLLVRETIETGQDPMDLLSTIQGHIVICTEVGLGVIPLDRHERTWREAVGRLCCAIAKEADCVVRVFAGMGQVLKGELPCISSQ